MIAHLTGKLLQKKPNCVVVDAHGVGYAVQIPLSTFYQLGDEGSSVSLRVHTYVREDTLALFGFLSDQEKALFEKLISISGIGPKLGISIMSGASVDDLVRSIRSGDLVRLTRIPGVGKKTAERMVLELRDKMPAVTQEEAPAAHSLSRLEEDVVSALVNLGYQQALAERVCAKTAESMPEAERTFETVLRLTLKRLSGNG
jgi:holliday junction DNA helicase RuvA